MSFGLPELFIVTAKKQQRICNEFMKLALQGHTMVFSSGDFGVRGNSNYNDKIPLKANGCVPQDLDNPGASELNGTIFIHDFPVNCPWVLGVGATMIEAGNTVADPETAMILPPKLSNSWSNFTTFGSGGRFFELLCASCVPGRCRVSLATGVCSRLSNLRIQQSRRDRS